jgi:hypothetical protein
MYIRSKLHPTQTGKPRLRRKPINLWHGKQATQLPSIQRKMKCSCGGGCPGCQTENSKLQAKFKIGAPNDKYEQEANHVADQVMRMSNVGAEQDLPENNEADESLQASPLANQITPLVQRQAEPEEEEEEEIQPKQKPGKMQASAPNFESRVNSLRGGGRPLPVSERAFFEPRFGVDFSQVRIHSDSHAAGVAQSINARAFTLGRDVVFGTTEYAPGSHSGRSLLAHELTHVVQQSGKAASGIQRTIELRPPGRGEATAFDRAQELVDRLNALSLALSYSLGADGRTLNYRILLPDRINNFDQQMMDFIDLEQVIPMRLITSAGTVGGIPIVGDDFLRGYVDLDDLMASDDLGFQSIMVHFLEERAVTRRYEQRIGTPGLDLNTPAGNRTFTRGHRAGHNAQAEHFRDVFNDPSIVFNRERRRNNAGDADIIFRSRTHNYRILVTLRRALTSAAGARPRNLTGGTVSVRHQGQNFTVEDFLTNGPLAATLRPLANPFGRRPDFGFNLPGLNLDPGLRLRLGVPGGFGQLPPLGPGIGPAPNLIPDPAAAADPVPQPNPLSNLSVPSLSPDPSLIDWLGIRGELNMRGAPFDDRMAGSITSMWNYNYSFLNRVIGFSPDRAAFWINKTIPMAVGAGVNRDFPSMIEQVDRELNTSSIIIPASDILMFLIGQ